MKKNIVLNTLLYIVAVAMFIVFAATSICNYSLIIPAGILVFNVVYTIAIAKKVKKLKNINVNK